MARTEEQEKAIKNFREHLLPKGTEMSDDEIEGLLRGLANVLKNHIIGNINKTIGD